MQTKRNLTILTRASVLYICRPYVKPCSGFTYMIIKFSEAAFLGLELAEAEVGREGEAAVGLGGLRPVTQTQGQDFGPTALKYPHLIVQGQV